MWEIKVKPCPLEQALEAFFSSAPALGYVMGERDSVLKVVWHQRLEGVLRTVSNASLPGSVQTSCDRAAPYDASRPRCAMQISNNGPGLHHVQYS